MPLLKKRPFALLEPPTDLDSNELVYQVRFTKEIFRNYQAYLNRINLYRQRIWSCKLSGKVNLTFEEALVSEKQAIEKVQAIPKEVMASALRVIQYSMLPLKELADAIATKLQTDLFVGAELQGRKDGDLFPCKILKVLEDTDKTQYEVAWLDENNEITGTLVANRGDLIWKKFPLSRHILKSFIRESTHRSAPWVLHNNLATKHGISTDIPQELKGQISIQNGLVVCNRKGKNAGEEEKKSVKHKKKKVEGEEVEAMNEENNKDVQPMEVPIKYPIDDLLVQPGPDDPIFTDRPSPSRDFNIQMVCVGDLLMVWDFCSSFGRMLHLLPFSLEDFENAICHKDSNLILIVETHSALLRLLIKDNGEYFLAVRRNRKLKITLVNWTEYMSDFLEMINIPDLSTHITTIKRGHYGLLDVQHKLGILRELVNQVLYTDLFREKLEEHIEQRHMLGATRREAALEEGRKRREGKERLKDDSVDNKVSNGCGTKDIENKPDAVANGKHHIENGEMKGQVFSALQNNASQKSDSNHSDIASKKTKQNGNVEVVEENIKISSVKIGSKLLKNEKEAIEKKSKEQMREYFEREIEKRVLRTNPLGKDRNYNRYWWFRRDGRIFVESSDSKLWGYYCSKEELDALMGSLNCKGEREKALHQQLQKSYDRICSELHKRSKDLANKIALEEAVLRRSTRVRAMPRENDSSFLRYVNKWKED